MAQGEQCIGGYIVPHSANCCTVLNLNDGLLLIKSCPRFCTRTKIVIFNNLYQEQDHTLKGCLINIYMFSTCLRFHHWRYRFHVWTLITVCVQNLCIMKLYQVKNEMMDDEEEGIIYSTLIMVEEKIQIIFTLCHNCVCNMLAE